jgi:hypothetical protein
MAMPFDPWRLQYTGGSFPILEGIVAVPGCGVAQFAISATGTLAYIPRILPQRTPTILWLDRRGEIRAQIAPNWFLGWVRISPGGDMLALEALEGANPVI